MSQCARDVVEIKLKCCEQTVERRFDHKDIALFFFSYRTFKILQAISH
jgi:hypothetical protein